MSADKAQLFGLIGLRALVEWDPAEYRRVSDRSKGSLDREIELLLAQLKDDECGKLYREITQPDRTSDDIEDDSLRLEDVYFRSIRRSESEALHAVQKCGRAKVELPSEIIDRTIRDAGLKWKRAEGEKGALRALDANVAEGGTPFFVAASLGVVASLLAKKGALVRRSRGARKSTVVWRICNSILRSIGYSITKDANKHGLWDAARRGEAERWLARHLIEAAGDTPATSVSAGNVAADVGEPTESSAETAAAVKPLKRPSSRPKRKK